MLVRKQYNIYLLFIGFLVLGFQHSYAQIDNKKEKSVPLTKGNDTKKADSVSLFDVKIKPTSPESSKKINGITVPERVTISPRKNKEFSMFGEDFRNPGELYQKQAKQHLRQFEKAEEKQYGSTTNQYFGDFKTKSLFVNVIYRDHEYFDGDRIQILVNDTVLVYDVLLTNEFSGIQIDLIDGFNRIDFLALNQGDSGPNTAEFQVYDDQGSLISGNRWNLSTGVKATVIVVKEATTQEETKEED